MGCAAVRARGAACLFGWLFISGVMMGRMNEDVCFSVTLH